MRKVQIHCHRGDREGLRHLLEEEGKKGWYAEKIRNSWKVCLVRRREQTDEKVRCRLVTCRSGPEGKWTEHFGKWSRRSGRPSEDGEFDAVRKSWEEKGWTFGCFFGCTAVFYGSERLEEGVRPVQGEEEKSLLLREESQLFVRLTAGGLAVVLLGALAAALFFVGRASRAEWEEFFLVLFTVWIIYSRFWALEAVLRPFVRRSIRLGKPLPAWVSFLSEESARAFLAVLTGGWAAGKLYVMGVTYQAAAMGAGTVLAVCCLLWLGIHFYKTGKPVPDFFSGALAVSLFIILLTAGFAWPSEGNYRFLVGKGGGSLYLKETAETVDALNTEDLGWGPWDSAYVRDNPSHYCLEERLTYTYFSDELAKELQEESSGFRFFSGGLASRLRYVGTLEGRLKKIDDLERFLRLKGLDLKEGEPVELVPEAKTWIWQDGRELVSLFKDGRVVIYFLNTWDERRFDLENSRERAGITRRLIEKTAAGRSEITSAGCRLSLAEA